MSKGAAEKHIADQRHVFMLNCQEFYRELGRNVNDI
jgi:hypothetical protein